MSDPPFNPNMISVTTSVVSAGIEVENAATAMVSSFSNYATPRRRPKPKALKKAVKVVKLDLRARKIRLED